MSKKRRSAGAARTTGATRSANTPIKARDKPKFPAWVPWLGAGLALLAIALSGFLVYRYLSRPLVATAVSLNPREYRAALALSREYNKGRVQRRVKLTEYQGPLSQALASKPDIVFFQAGAGARASAESLCRVPDDLRALYPLNVLWQSHLNKKQYALPIAFDYFGPSLSLEAKSALKLGELTTWPEFKAAAQALAKAGYLPLVVPGGDDEVLLSFFSALCHALGGSASYQSLSQASLAGSSPIQLLSREPSSLVLTELKSMVREGSLMMDWQDMNHGDCGSLLASAKKPGLYLSFLSQEPELGLSDPSQYARLALPGQAANAYGLCPSILLGCAKPRLNAATDSFMRYAAGHPGQVAASQASGYAPAILSVPNRGQRQRLARSWADAADDIGPGLGHDGFKDAKARLAFTAALRDALR